MAVNDNFTGPTTSVLIVKESTYGTDPASGYVHMGILQAEVNATLNTNVEAIHALGALEPQALMGKQVNVTGTISGIFQDAKLLAFAMGADAVTGVGPYDHWINYKTAAASPVEISSLPSFTMVITRGTDGTTYANVEKYTGCRIDRISVTGDLGAPLTISADFIAQNVSVTVSTGNQVASFSSDEVQAPNYTVLKIPTATTLSEVQKFELTIRNNLEPVFALGSQLLQALVRKQLDIELTGTLVLTDEAIWALKDIMNDASSPYTFGGNIAPKPTETISIVTTNGGATTTERSMTISISAAAIGELTMPARVGEISMTDFTATIKDFTQTNWGATPTGAPIVYRNNTSGVLIA